MERLAALDRVRVVDLKAYYRGTSVDLEPDPELYRALVESLPEVVIEDPWLEDGCREALAGAETGSASTRPSIRSPISTVCRSPRAG